MRGKGGARGAVRQEPFTPDHREEAWGLEDGVEEWTLAPAEEGETPNEPLEPNPEDRILAERMLRQLLEGLEQLDQTQARPCFRRISRMVFLY